LRRVVSTALIAIAMLPWLVEAVPAAEAATGVYVLGSRAVGAGITPPRESTSKTTPFFYSGKIGGGTTLPLGGLLIVNVSATTRGLIFR